MHREGFVPPAVFQAPTQSLAPSVSPAGVGILQTAGQAGQEVMGVMARSPAAASLIPWGCRQNIKRNIKGPTETVKLEEKHELQILTVTF